MASGSDPGGDRSPREGIVSKLETCLGAAARKRTIGVANTLRAESGSLAAAVEGARIQQHSRSGRVPNLLAHIGRCVLGGQIVDARDPLFYYSEDLASYARELDSETRTLILLNKADLVPGEVRRQWASYFESKGLGYAFWSAKHSTDESAEFDKPEEDSRMRVLGATELLDLLESLRPPSKVCTLFLNRQADFANVQAKIPSEMDRGQQQNRTMVGFVGYPNVGKSSTINALFGRKKTPVASTPGRTKHFQTLNVRDTLCLCDCPGLMGNQFFGACDCNAAVQVSFCQLLPSQRRPWW